MATNDPIRPGPQFSLRRLLALLTIPSALFAITAVLGWWSLPFWLAAALMVLILRPR